MTADSGPCYTAGIFPWQGQMHTPLEKTPLEKITRAGRLDREEALRLARVTGTELLDVMSAAATLRDWNKGRVVSYSRKVFIPLTNLCRNQCAYCAFSRLPGDADAQIMEPDEVLAIARAGAAEGCKEALFCLGERPEERYEEARRALWRLGYRNTVDFLAAMCTRVWEDAGLLPHFNAGVLDETEMTRLAAVSLSGGLMLESSSERLCESRGPHFGCPGKAPGVRMATIDLAGRLRVPFTTGILIGIGETAEERVESLCAIAETQQRHGHIQEVIVQNFQPHPGTRMAKSPAPDTIEMLRTLALARLILGGEMNLQAPPNLGPAVYQLYLLAGINDWGGISPVTSDRINPDAPWPSIAELERVTGSAGFTLRERLALYPEHIRGSMANPRFADAIKSLVDLNGYVQGGSYG